MQKNPRSPQEDAAKLAELRPNHARLSLIRSLTTIHHWFLAGFSIPFFLFLFSMGREVIVSAPEDLIGRLFGVLLGATLISLVSGSVVALFPLLGAVFSTGAEALKDVRILRERRDIVHSSEVRGSVELVEESGETRGGLEEVRSQQGALEVTMGDADEDESFDFSSEEQEVSEDDEQTLSHRHPPHH